MKIKIFVFFIFFVVGCIGIQNENKLNLSFEHFVNGKIQLWEYSDKNRVRIDSTRSSNGEKSVVLYPDAIIQTSIMMSDSTEESLLEIEFDYIQDIEDYSQITISIIQSKGAKKINSISDTISVKNKSGWSRCQYKTNYKKGFSVFVLQFKNISTSKIWLDNFKITLNKHVVRKKDDNLTKHDFIKIKDALNVLPIQNHRINQKEFKILSKLIINKKLVSLGETTHGTKEIFLAKNEIIKYLVENDDYNTIIFEGNKGDLDLANRFISNDTINGVDSAILKVFGCYRTKEIRELFEWIQKYNLDKLPEKQLVLTGCDVQSDLEPFKQLKEFALKKNDDKFIEILNNYREEYKVPELLSFIKEMKNRLFSSKKNLNINQYDNLLSQIILIEQFVKFDSGMKSRDFFMAKNISNIIDANPRNKAIFWAHNEHVKKTKRPLSGSTGLFLKDSFNVDQYVIGFALNEGDYRARTDSTDYIEGNILQETPMFTYEYLLKSLKLPAYFLVMEKIKPVQPFVRKKGFRFIGSSVPHKSDFKLRDIINSFDAIIYLDKTTSADGLNYAL